MSLENSGSVYLQKSHQTLNVKIEKDSKKMNTLSSFLIVICYSTRYY